MAVYWRIIYPGFEGEWRFGVGGVVSYLEGSWAISIALLVVHLKIEILR